MENSYGISQKEIKKSSNINCLKSLVQRSPAKKETSNKMNNFFCSVGVDLANKLVSNPLISGDYDVNTNKTKFHFRTIEIQDIRDAFAKIKQLTALESTISLAIL